MKIAPSDAATKPNSEYETNFPTENPSGAHAPPVIFDRHPRVASGPHMPMQCAELNIPTTNAGTMSTANEFMSVHKK